MKVSKKKVLNAVLGLSVLGAIAIGGTFAYLTDTEQSESVFIVGNVIVDLVETDSPPLDTTVVPNEEIPLEGYLVNSGSVNAIVYMELEVPAYGDNSYRVASDVGIPMDMVSDSPLFSVVSTGGNLSLDSLDGVDGWKLVRSAYNDIDETVVYTYGYSEVLSAGNQASLPFNAVKVANIIRDSEDEGPYITFNTAVRAYAIQADYVTGSDSGIAQVVDTSGTVSQTDLTYIFNTLCNQEQTAIENGMDNANVSGKLKLNGDPR